MSRRRIAFRFGKALTIESFVHDIPVHSLALVSSNDGVDVFSEDGSD